MKRVAVGVGIDRNGVDAERLQVRMMRTAISPRLAIRREPIIASHPVDGSVFGQVDLAGGQRQAKPKHVAGLPRLDDAVVP